MEQEQLEFFKDLLQKQLDELTKSGQEVVSGMKDQENAYADLVDQASNDASQEFLFRIKDRESRLINKIKDALERIEDGSYGLCETCGEEISIGRLTARPVATHCIVCKTAAEKMEKIVNMSK